MEIIHWNNEQPLSGKDLLPYLEQEGGVCLRNFPFEDNVKMLQMGWSLGQPLRPKAQFQQQFLEDEFVYRVQFEAKGNGGVISQTRLGFPLHTDGFRAPKVPDYMFLLVIKQADEGGASQFLHIDEVVRNLPRSTVKSLLEDTYIFSSGVSRPILSHTKLGYEIAFNPYDVAGIRVSERDVNPERAFADKMSRQVFDFYRSLETSPNKTSLRLQTGDCIVLDNKKVLHARSAYAGSRLLKRMWVLKQPEKHEAIH